MVKTRALDSSTGQSWVRAVGAKKWPERRRVAVCDSVLPMCVLSDQYLKVTPPGWRPGGR